MTAGTKRWLQVRILQAKNFAGCQEICRLAGKSNVKGRNLRVCRFLLVLFKNEVFLLVIVAINTKTIIRLVVR